MAMMNSSVWGGGMHHTMHLSRHDDDFQQFLDLSGRLPINNMAHDLDPSAGLGFDFHDFQASSAAVLQMQARDPLDAPMIVNDAPDVLSRTGRSMQHQSRRGMSAMTSGVPFQTIPATLIAPPTSTEAIVDSIDVQIQYLQQQKMQHQQRQLQELFTHQTNPMMPSTRQSLDLQSMHNPFYASRATPSDAASQAAGQHHRQDQLQHQRLQQQQLQQVKDYRFQRLTDSPEMFRPLVSPAVAPRDLDFSIDQFTVPADYVSPMTSPALHAQTDCMAPFDPVVRPGTDNSPMAMDFETTPPPFPLQALAPVEAPRKSRKAAKTRAKPGVRSPIAKPQKKTLARPKLAAQMMSELTENGHSIVVMRRGSVLQEQHQAQPSPLPQRLSQQVRTQNQPPTAAPLTSASSTVVATDSENGSVSPEALNDNMFLTKVPPPPPVPMSPSTKPSPCMTPQLCAATPSLTARPDDPPPATPASLMMLRSPGQHTADGADSPRLDDTEPMEAVELPERVTKSKSAASGALRIKNVNIKTQSPAPSPHSRTFQPLPSPAVARSMSIPSANSSPQIAAGSSAASTPSNVRKTPQLAPRGKKKRASVGSSQVSPALRPKISPTTKPLIPGSVLAEDSTSHLLATKSNYQRILDGNTVPGVTYPSELSSNLTSRRTSHKIAEQGRRNRINSALQEMATLLPRPSPDSNDSEGGGDKKEKGTSTAPNSKAGTVELAIEYIKQLQREVEEANRRAEEAEKRLGKTDEDAEATGVEEGGDEDSMF